jgi:hypothetical protein
LRSRRSGRTLGVPHFDIGVEVTTTKIDSNASYWQDAVNGNVLILLPVPKVHARLGVPFTISIGALYSTVPTLKISLAGGEIKWAFN